MVYCGFTFQVADMYGKRILLIVSGGIAAIKVPELIRGLRERGALVRCVLTDGGKQFVNLQMLDRFGHSHEPLEEVDVNGQTVGSQDCKTQNNEILSLSGHDCDLYD